jgi:hypothetical protein
MSEKNGTVPATRMRAPEKHRAVRGLSREKSPGTRPGLKPRRKEDVQQSHMITKLHRKCRKNRRAKPNFSLYFEWFLSVHV